MNEISSPKEANRVADCLKMLERMEKEGKISDEERKKILRRIER